MDGNALCYVLLQNNEFISMFKVDKKKCCAIISNCIMKWLNDNAHDLD